MNWKNKWVVLTTDNERRGVFYGKLAEWDEEKRIAVLEKAKMIVYWSEETKGVLGLASDGPGEGSRVTSAVEAIELDGVTSIMLTSQKAQKRFKEEIWR